MKRVLILMLISTCCSSSYAFSFSKLFDGFKDDEGNFTVESNVVFVESPYLEDEDTQESEETKAQNGQLDIELEESQEPENILAELY